MSAFEHVTALWSFVYALALTHLLALIAELIVARVTACVFPGCSRWAWTMPFSWSSPTGCRSRIFVRSRVGILLLSPSSSWLPFQSS